MRSRFVSSYHRALCLSPVACVFFLASCRSRLPSSTGPLRFSRSGNERRLSPGIDPRDIRCSVPRYLSRANQSDFYLFSRRYYNYRSVYRGNGAAPCILDISRVSLTGNHVIPRCYLLASADASRFFHYRNVFSTRARANGKVGGASRTFFERQFARHRERVRDATRRTNGLRRMREKTFRPTNERTRQRARATTRNSCEDA